MKLPILVSAIAATALLLGVVPAVAQGLVETAQHDFAHSEAAPATRAA